MCLVSKTKEPSVSGYNIECYKILIPIGDKLVTPYRDFSFTLNKIYVDEEKESIQLMWDKYMIEQGFFHSFKNIEIAKFRVEELIRRCKRNKIKPRDYKIYKAIIPSVTKYFEGDMEDLCSKALKIIEECCD